MLGKTMLCEYFQTNSSEHKGEQEQMSGILDVIFESKNKYIKRFPTSWKWKREAAGVSMRNWPPQVTCQTEE